MFKRIFTFILALICLVAFSSAQAVTTAKKHDSTTVTTVVNFKVEMPKVKSDFADITVITSALKKLAKSDSVITNKLVELDRTITSSKCNSPPDPLIKYHKVKSVVGILGVVTLFISIFFIMFNEIPIPLKLGYIGLICLLVITLYLLLPDIISFIPGFFNDA